jgi:RimJ/RimL family protein N-acetyltransferase
MVLETERLRLRPWCDGDGETLARINADPRVMEFYPAPLSREESDAMLARLREHFVRHGFGLWAAELRATGELIGYIGLSWPSVGLAYVPGVEIGWRLDVEHWNRGLATEGAREALRYGFEVLGLEEIFAYTTAGNLRSRRVMEKLGMRHDAAADFDHPRLPEAHPLLRHVVYRLGRAQ